jgi:hypothetical protein
MNLKYASKKLLEIELKKLRETVNGIDKNIEQLVSNKILFLEKMVKVSNALYTIHTSSK